MCTLTYIPTDEGYIFTHNRDERQDRPTSRDFQTKQLNNQTIYFPQDLEALGTWIAYSDNGVSVCLLNGGSEAHKRKGSYRKSRGLVVLESFEYTNPINFKEEYDFNEIEPFTLLIRSADKLHKLVHNVDSTFIEELPVDNFGIWSSTTLYTKEVRDKRRAWFNKWLDSKPKFEKEIVRRFHLSAGDGDSENDLVMSRWGILKTVSLTQIGFANGITSLHYEDFVAQNTDELSLTLQA